MQAPWWDTHRCSLAENREAWTMVLWTVWLSPMTSDIFRGWWCFLFCLVLLSSLATLWTVASQAFLSMGFPRQEHRRGLPFLSGDLPDPGTEPLSPALADGFLTTEPPGEPGSVTYCWWTQESFFTFLSLHFLICRVGWLSLTNS